MNAACGHKLGNIPAKSSVCTQYRHVGTKKLVLAMPSHIELVVRMALAARPYTTTACTRQIAKTGWTAGSFS